RLDSFRFGWNRNESGYSWFAVISEPAGDSTRLEIILESDDYGLNHFVIATPDLVRGKQSRAAPHRPGLPRDLRSLAMTKQCKVIMV
ncbi:MAG TPA: hypothetical protein VJM34_01455, partial [Novosphingobium sp.]|nr:hypothetical protein [Novosphingobium sp.]